MSLARDSELEPAREPPALPATELRPRSVEPVRLLRAPLVPAALSVDELVGLELEPGTRDVARRLFARGASSELVREVLEELLGLGARGAWAIDAATDVLARAFPILPSPKRPRPGERVPLIACVGPTGVGKTTALIELGRKLRATGRRIAWAALDAETLLALEQRMGEDGLAPGALVRDVADLNQLLRRDGTLEAVLLDTPGISPREGERLRALAGELARCTGPCVLATLLVLSAATARGALELTARAFTLFRPDGVVLTKLDETDEPAVACEALARARLPLAFLCAGRNGRAHLRRPTPEGLAELVLFGRLPASEAA